MHLVVKFQTEAIFETLKSHLKRAPSLKGAALVKLSQLKIQAYTWPVLLNLTQIGNMLDKVSISLLDMVSMRILTNFI